MINKEELKKEAIKQLNDIAKIDDTETAHINADDVLCNLLSTLGYQDVIDAYMEVDK